MHINKNRNMSMGISYPESKIHDSKIEQNGKAGGKTSQPKLYELK